MAKVSNYKHDHHVLGRKKIHRGCACPLTTPSMRGRGIGTGLRTGCTLVFENGNKRSRQANCESDHNTRDGSSCEKPSDRGVMTDEESERQRHTNEKILVRSLHDIWYCKQQKYVGYETSQQTTTLF